MTDGPFQISFVTEPAAVTMAPVRRRLNPRARLVAAAAVAVLAAGVALWWFAIRTPAVAITHDGLPVSNARQALQTAEVRFQSLVRADHGRTSRASQCSFVRIKPHGGDITDSVLCGPVLFYDGAPNHPYLSYPLHALPDGHGEARLTVASAPTNGQPEAAPGRTLVRPSGTATSLRSAGFAAPIPPSAAEDALVATADTHPSALHALGAEAAMGSDHIKITLISSGPVTDYGVGTQERSAPPGQQLFAFRLAFGSGEHFEAAPATLTLGVSVNGAAPHQLPLAAITNTGSHLFVTALPGSASTATLVLHDGGITQRLDLRTGEPGSGNIDFLRHSTRLQLAPATATTQAQVKATKPVTTRLTIHLSGTETYFFVPIQDQLGRPVAPPTLGHPPSPHDVYLELSLCYMAPKALAVDACVTFGGAGVTVTPTGGTPVHLAKLGRDEGELYDVPASMTRGTITFSGSDGSGPYRVTFPKPVTVPFELTPQS
ncbi:hypothetical protein [Jatrophihabitans sp.]|uniref:hypothetical protein n=1 Tax=Jatrophihabitans sp. TaxID=1932789 RepID=UPI0030C6E463|nr:hypothetical protein [Jatrophihabitans sp.]